MGVFDLEGDGVRERFNRVILGRMRGLKRREISERLGIPERTLTSFLTRITKERGETPDASEEDKRFVYEFLGLDADGVREVEVERIVEVEVEKTVPVEVKVEVPVDVICEVPTIPEGLWRQIESATERAMAGDIKGCCDRLLKIQRRQEFSSL